MEVKGTIINILTQEAGTSKIGEWKKSTVIIELENNNKTSYNKRLALNCYNDLSEQAQGLVLKDTITASINVESREYQGKWYTEVKPWKIDRIDKVKDQPKQTVHTNGQDNQNQKTFKELEVHDFSDLPF